VIAAAALALVAAYPLSAWFPEPTDARVASLLGFLLAMVPAALFMAGILRAPLPPRLLGLIVVLGLALGFLAAYLEMPALAAPFKIAAAAAAGRLLGVHVPGPRWLAFMAGLVLLIDAWSVFFGPTKAIVEATPSLLEYLLVVFPSAGGSVGAALGVTDFVFLAFFTVGSAITGLRHRLGFTLMAASFPVSLGLAMGLERGLPALPLLGLAFLLANADLLASRGGTRRKPPSAPTPATGPTAPTGPIPPAGSTTPAVPTDSKK